MHIAILTGGISEEREVALRSGSNINSWVQIAGHTSDLYDFPSEIDAFLSTYQSYDLVIPMFHGIYGEDGQITAFLQTLGCRYASSDREVHALCIDKHRTNTELAPIGVHIPSSELLRKSLPYHTGDITLTFPLIVKPNRGGSSLATSRVTSEAELSDAISLVHDDDILIQECIEGCEFTVGVYRDQDRYQSLPIVEIRTISGDFFDYEEKYETDGSNEVFLEGEIELQDRLRKESEKIAEYLNTRGVVRIDWRYDGSDLYFLEVNTIPGFTSGSLVPKMWKRAGKDEKGFIEMLLGENH